MALTKSQAAHQRLRQVDNTYRAKHQAAHDAFNKEFDRLARKHGAIIAARDLSSVNRLPRSMVEDPEFIAAKHSHLAAISKAQQEQRTHVATMPYSRIEFQRTSRTLN